MVPQAIGISLRNRIGDSAGEFLVIFPLGVFIGTMGLILLTCSLFILVSGLHFIVCSSIDTPLYWYDPCLAFYHCLLCIHRFLAKSPVHMRILANSHVYMQFFGQNLCIHAGFWPKVVTYVFVLYTVAYILPFGEFDVLGSCWVGCECGWVFLGSDVVCWMLLL